MEPKIEDGGQAFPTPEDEHTHHIYGMTLRDWFAGQALPTMTTDLVADDDDEAFDVAARDAYRAADAMLRARTKAGAS